MESEKSARDGRGEGEIQAGEKWKREAGRHGGTVLGWRNEWMEETWGE